MLNKLFFILALSLLSLNAFAQTPKTISAGIVNSKALSLPKPEYSQAMRDVRASGEVKVQVTIDEKGDVISAQAVSGHPLLRQVSEQAALKATFTPTTLSGQPVKVTGVIVYNFVNEKTNAERVKPLETAVFLYVLRDSVTDLDRLNAFMESKDFIEESFPEFPDLTKELAPLSAVKNTPLEKRMVIVDGVIVAVQTKLGAKDAWQFELGKNFGQIFAQLTRATSGDDFDLSKINENALRVNLTKIKEMNSSAPADFPIDVLEKFRQFGELSEKKSLIELESLREVLEKLLAIVETIEPSVGK